MVYAVCLPKVRLCLVLSFELLRGRYYGTLPSGLEISPREAEAIHSYLSEEQIWGLLLFVVPKSDSVVVLGQGTEMLSAPNGLSWKP